MERVLRRSAPGKRFAVALMIALWAIATSTATAAAAPHWAGSGDRNVTVLDSVTLAWDTALSEATSDWSASPFLDLVVTPDSSTKRMREKCPSAVGGIRVCNANYGATGWAGLANYRYTTNGHIVRARARLNTKYVSSAHAMRTVACHEIGHTLGLDHRAQSAANSCLTPILSTGASPDVTDLANIAALHNHADARASAADEQVTVERNGPYTDVTVKLLADR